MNKTLKPWFLLLAAMAPTLSWALSSDRNQPMLIEADRAELNDAEGISIYRGNVKVTQGTLVLTGETMTVYNKGDDVDKVVMDGDPATYKQRPDNKDQDVHAKAQRMEYYTAPEKVILLKKAEVEQEGKLLTSERIVYDVVKDHVNAGTDNDRVKITVPPKTPEPPPQSVDTDPQ